MWNKGLLKKMVFILQEHLLEFIWYNFKDSYWLKFWHKVISSKEATHYDHFETTTIIIIMITSWGH